MDNLQEMEEALRQHLCEHFDIDEDDHQLQSFLDHHFRDLQTARQVMLQYGLHELVGGVESMEVGGGSDGASDDSSHTSGQMISEPSSESEDEGFQEMLSGDDDMPSDY